MLRYEIIANVGISVDLHNNYTVVALAKWNKEKESYLATFYIKQTDIDHLDLMDDQIEIEFSSEIKTIKLIFVSVYISLNNSSFYKHFNILH